MEVTERQAAGTGASWTQLDALEAESIFILREVAAECRNVALLFSGGKDSAVVLRLAEKAFFPEKMPFTMLHVDTEHNFPEVIAYRDQVVRDGGHNLVVRSVGDSIKAGRVRLRTPDESRNPHQSVTLLDAIAEFEFDACIGGARRDEEKARAKERVFSFRDEFGQWDPKNQRPEIWSIYNGRVHKGENVRVFPISNWTELDVWQYIQREEIPLPSIYFAHRRPIIRRKESLVPVTRHHAAQGGRSGGGAAGAVSHRGRHHLHGAGGFGRDDHRRDRPRNRADHDHRARRDAAGRPGQRGGHGAAQARGILLRLRLRPSSMSMIEASLEPVSLPASGGRDALRGKT